LAPVSAGLRALDRFVLKWRPLRRYAFRTVIVLKMAAGLRERLNDIAG
jgi:hypothetical protein